MYIERQYRMPLVYLLFIYKVIELSLFYIFFYHKPYSKVLETKFHTHFEEKFKMNAKRFFFLVPQGSIVFGFLAYGLSGEIKYLWYFLIMATVMLIVVNPKRLNEDPTYDPIVARH
jgi:hypothetical protein